MSNEVSLIHVTDGKGAILLGRRNDNQKWTMPGGHLEEGETPKEGAVRELFEETGLKPESMHFLRTVDIDGVKVHCFTALAFGRATSVNDPDNECYMWRWVDAKDGLPKLVWGNLNGPQGDDNILRQVFDIQKSEAESILVKSNALLNHPNPIERLLALKSPDVTPYDVLVGATDSDEVVWEQALQHPQSAYARGVICASTRYQGKSLWKQQCWLMVHGNMTHDELVRLYYAILHDDDMMPGTQDHHLDVVAAHPAFRGFDA